MRGDVYRVAKRKFNTFRKNPLGSTKDKTVALVRWLGNFPKDPIGSINAEAQVGWLLKRWGAHKFRQKEALDVVFDFLADRPPNAIPPDFADLWFLYHTVKRRKPRIILEFGSGCSTAVLAQALWNNQRNSPKSGGYLYSLEADPYWAEVTTQSIPTRLRAFCEIVYTPLLGVEHKGTLGFRHANVPGIVPNLLYLDGPALTPTRQVSIDVLDIEDKLHSDFYMIIDGRRENTLFFKKYLKRRYLFKERKFFNNQTFELID